MRDFRAAISSGIMLCWAANTFWCYFVLHIVPQTSLSTGEAGEAGEWGSNRYASMIPEDVSLAHSASIGEISTVPVVEVIKYADPTLLWVATVSSILYTLSYTTVGGDCE
jgi:hypothetical protein